MDKIGCYRTNVDYPKLLDKEKIKPIFNKGFRVNDIAISHSVYDQKFLDRVSNNISNKEDRRYQRPLPFANSDPSIPNFFQQAFRQFEEQVSEEPGIFYWA